MPDQTNISEMLAKVLDQKPIFENAELKCIALAGIAHNFAISAKRGRPIFMTSIAKDVMAANGMAAGIDLNQILMLQMMQGKDDTKPVEPVVEDLLVKLVDRLDVIEAKFEEL
tara:strand:+ start:80 stop:418 length:339 start_codon:yes stop_codon:yes gene_type:complete